jgi:hypothetical protein
MTFRLTKEDSMEVGHKLGILADEPELQESYSLTQDQADALRKSVPHNGGEWEVPTEALEAVKGEMLDHVEILRTIAGDCRGSDMGQSLRIAKQATRFERMFS